MFLNAQNAERKSCLESLGFEIVRNNKTEAMVWEIIAVIQVLVDLFTVISNLSYNAFVGGVIAAVACVFGFMIRNFVVKNEYGFKAIEN